jgi:hypothetical protein
MKGIRRGFRVLQVTSAIRFEAILTYLCLAANKEWTMTCQQCNDKISYEGARFPFDVATVLVFLVCGYCGYHGWVLCSSELPLVGWRVWNRIMCHHSYLLTALTCLASFFTSISIIINQIIFISELTWRYKIMYIITFTF